MTEIVKVTACDMEEGTFLEVPKEVAIMSVTLKNILEDFQNSDVPIPLHNVTRKILELVLRYCTYHHEHPTPPNPEEEDKPKWDREIIPWDKEFCTVDQATLFELILAANYLDIKPLLDLTCLTVANMLRGKSAEDIRKQFNIKNDFTPEEEEKIRKDNGWIEDNNTQ